MPISGLEMMLMKNRWRDNSTYSINWSEKMNIKNKKDEREEGLGNAHKKNPAPIVWNSTLTGKMRYSEGSSPGIGRVV